MLYEFLKSVEHMSMIKFYLDNPLVANVSDEHVNEMALHPEVFDAKYD